MRVRSRHGSYVVIEHNGVQSRVALGWIPILASLPRMAASISVKDRKPLTEMHREGIVRYTREGLIVPSEFGQQILSAVAPPDPVPVPSEPVYTPLPPKVYTLVQAHQEVKERQASAAERGQRLAVQSIRSSKMFAPGSVHLMGDSGRNPACKTRQFSDSVSSEVQPTEIECRVCVRLLESEWDKWVAITEQKGASCSPKS